MSNILAINTSLLKQISEILRSPKMESQKQTLGLLLKDAFFHYVTLCHHNNFENIFIIKRLHCLDFWKLSISKGSYRLCDSEMSQTKDTDRKRIFFFFNPCRQFKTAFYIAVTGMSTNIGFGTFVMQYSL